jgi:phosphopantothenoylcysteine decarboxylase/phosphopantothenate--cysteine ligase
MYRHPIVVENIKKLQSLNVEFIGPRIEEGKAKIAEAKEIVDTVIQKLTLNKDLAGKKILITAGSTLEYLDPIRVMTNKSSGKTGVAIAEEALSRGAEVILIYGSGTAAPPAGAKTVLVETSEEMRDAVVSELKSKKYDVVVAAAAVADWAPERKYKKKIPTSTSSELIVRLKPTPKIADEVKKVSPSVLLVAFRAESGVSDEELIESAYNRLRKAKADLIIANDVGRKGVGFGYDTNEVFIVDASKKAVHVSLTTKREVAKRLFDFIAEKLRLESSAKIVARRTLKTDRDKE